MKEQNNLFEQYKNLADTSSSEDFPSKEKIWDRIDAKLDQKVLTKEKSVWQKTAIAATVLLTFSVLVIWLQNKPEKPITTPKDESTTLVKEQLKITTDSSTTATALVIGEQESAYDNNTTLNTNPLQDELARGANEATYTVSEEPSGTYTFSAETISNISEKQTNTENDSREKGIWLGYRKFDSRGIEHKPGMEVTHRDNDKKTTPKSNTKVEDPLVVIDNKVSMSDISEMTEEERENLVILKEPLYIINGVYYTEQEVFGPNPTSPYTPLNKQKIETIAILRDEKAVSIYGEKGKNGVVIITTKDGKPTPTNKK